MRNHAQPEKFLHCLGKDPPNSVTPYGLFQMSGNMAEWGVDWYDLKYYATAPNTNPKGLEKETQRSFRGGGWVDSTPSVRTAQRNGTDPNTKMNWMGFRCARDAKDAGEATEAKPEQMTLR